jgi:hypothetical protein
VSFPVAVVISDLTVSNMVAEHTEAGGRKPERKRLFDANFANWRELKLAGRCCRTANRGKRISKLVAADVSPLQSQAKFE